MSRGLVVVEPDDAFEGLVEEAAAFARGGDAELTVVTLINPDSFEQDAETLGTIGNIENVSYSENTVLEGHRSSLERFVAPLLSNVDYECHVAVTDPDDRAEKIMDVADSVGSDHLFVHGRRRSPTGKALFGDTTQRLLLNFDGYVTVAMTDHGYGE